MSQSNTITITLTKEDMLTSVESLIWKHGEAVANGENYRQKPCDVERHALADFHLLNPDLYVCLCCHI